MSRSELHTEWLLADQRGLFAMGSPEGIRNRKYHGFALALAGRSQVGFLLDFEMECAGQKLWPHRYGSPGQGTVVYPDLSDLSDEGKFEFTDDPYPCWTWKLEKGKLTLDLRAGAPGGIALRWTWTGKTPEPVTLKLRPFFGMRDLHGNGGREWGLTELDGQRAKVQARQGGAELQVLAEGGWRWQADEVWYQRFHYSEEAQRGYTFEEDLFSAGEWCVELKGAPRGKKVSSDCSLVFAEDPLDLEARSWESKKGVRGAQPRVMDFALTRPAGVVAGFPWFGEWGRDTFISLPGMAASWLRSSGDKDAVWEWTSEVLSRWGDWVGRDGMIPNLIDKGGKPQWESSDGTLWWTHSLASLWQLSLAGFDAFAPVREKYQGLLGQAIDSIRAGRHRFLRVNEEGLLEVTGAHSTWMDARVEGTAVTPRLGVLPEINALWFQARCLHDLWSEKNPSIPTGQAGLPALETTGKAILSREWGDIEQMRPNLIFLHSLPLAPSFVLNDAETLIQDVSRIAQELWTPVGLRTLSPTHPDYRGLCHGTQEERDRSYHQGTVWAWLGGHYEMARARLPAGTQLHHKESLTFPEGTLAEMPIRGHIPEILDGNMPHAPRGAPAQAWSLACLEEARIRGKLRADTQARKFLAERLSAGKGARASTRKRSGIRGLISRKKETGF